jgi:hypothetical protein
MITATLVVGLSIGAHTMKAAGFAFPLALSFFPAMVFR